jgi:hypothetical protein
MSIMSEGLLDLQPGIQPGHMGDQLACRSCLAVAALFQVSNTRTHRIYGRKLTNSQQGLPPTVRLHIILLSLDHPHKQPYMRPRRNSLCLLNHRADEGLAFILRPAHQLFRPQRESLLARCPKTSNFPLVLLRTTYPVTLTLRIQTLLSARERERRSSAGARPDHRKNLRLG